jgi:hypothetical protein
LNDASFFIQLGTGATVQVAPALSARAGITFGEHFTGSLRAIAVVGSEGKFVGVPERASDAAGYQAASIFLELRLHARKHGQAFQPFLALGVGVGKLFSTNSACYESPPIEGILSHYEQVTAGFQVVFKNRYWVSLELGANGWNGVSRERFEFTQALPKSSLWGGIFLISVGIRTGQSDGRPSKDGVYKR